MISISELFKRIGGIQAKEIAFRAGVQKAVKDVVGADIPIEDISFKSGGVSFKNLSQAARSAIFIKKEKIIKVANSLQSTYHIIDIR